MSCPVCKRAKCKWIELKDPTKVKTERLEQVIQHNGSYIDMIFRDGDGSALAEERMIASLEPYAVELDRRRKNEKKK